MSSDDPKISVSRRENIGTSASRRMRASGQIPGSLYGHKEESIPFTVAESDIVPVIRSGHKVIDLEIEGIDQKVMLQDVQWDTFSKFVQHVDLLRVDVNERITTDVEVVLRGVSPGVLNGGILEQPHHTLTIECPVIRIMEHIEVRIAALEIGDSITVGDLNLHKDVTITLPDEEVLVQVVEPRAPDPLEGEEGAASESAEPEVIGEGDADGESSESED